VAALPFDARCPKAFQRFWIGGGALLPAAGAGGRSYPACWLYNVWPAPSASRDHKNVRSVCTNVSGLEDETSAEMEIRASWFS